VIKAEFSASLLQSSVSHDHIRMISEGSCNAQETFMIIINVENCFYIFVSGFFE